LNASLPQLAIEKDGSGSLLRRYVYGQGLLSMTTGGSARYFLPDGQGTVANVTSSTGTTQWTYTYEPFGSTRSATSGTGAPTNLMRFDGQLVDGTTGLYDLRARMYDAASGRFLERDPLTSTGKAPYVATYSFVRDRPTVATDPSGLWCLIHNSDGGCLGASVANAVANFISENRWRIATTASGVGCALTGGAGCVVMVATYIGGQTAVLYEDYDGQLSLALMANASCGALKTVGGVLLGIGPVSNAVITSLPVAGEWWASPGCWSPPK
jgi:RHS repeat-associated protein